MTTAQDGCLSALRTCHLHPQEILVNMQYLYYYRTFKLVQPNPPKETLSSFHSSSERFFPRGHNRFGFIKRAPICIAMRLWILLKTATTSFKSSFHKLGHCISSSVYLHASDAQTAKKLLYMPFRHCFCLNLLALTLHVSLDYFLLHG